MEASFKSTLTDKRQRYAQFLEQFAPLIEGEKNEISVLANTSAALKEAFGFFQGRLLPRTRRRTPPWPVSGQRGLLPHQERTRRMRHRLG